MEDQIKSKKSESKLYKFQNREYILELCKSLPILMIKTNHGIGKYIFKKVIYQNNNISLLFRISDKNKSEKYKKIQEILGKDLIITESQYLHAYRWYAIA